MAKRGRPAAPKDDPQATVLAQPHRRGETSQKAESAFGRFCLRNRLGEPAWLAGEEYREAVQRFRILKGIPGSTAHGQRGEAGGEVTAAQVDAAYNLQKSLTKVMYDKTATGFYAMWGMAVEGEDSPPVDKWAIDAVAALATHLGYLPADGSPFARPLTAKAA
jgi:hypothetical protein